MNRRILTIGLALFFLNASLTFRNLWPTPGIAWRGGLSIELAVCVFMLAALQPRCPPPSTRRARWLPAAWTMLVVGRYAEVTAPALYGRDINLYWDLRFIPDVVRMIGRVAPIWLIAASLAGAGLALALFYRIVSLAWRTVAAACADPPVRRAVIGLSGAVMLGWALQLAIGRAAFAPPFAAPVVLTYARQAAFVAESLAGSSPLAASPPLDSDLSRVGNADVFLVFVESYGAVSFDRPDIAGRLAAARQELDAAVQMTNRHAVSAYVESPTFGGSSWLAHLSLMSGVEVRDQHTSARLMTEHRDTLVRAFGRRGFRTVALMPGLRQSWPEGAFYGFDDIYGAGRLAYRGPEFGWFAIPDQYSLERLDKLEAARPERMPLFVCFPTLSTHFPFNPTPPYQRDWTRIATAHPFDGPAIVRAYARQPDWMNFTPGYIDAFSYELATFAGYLEKHADRDLVMVLAGDHQPPALVSGQGASWEVPVHVIASRTAILDRLAAHGFRPGLRPERPALVRMHELLPVLLDSFGDR